MSALIYCFHCQTPVNFQNGKPQRVGGSHPTDTLEGDARCTRCGAMYRMTIVMLREPARPDAPPNVSDHARKT